MSAKPSFDPILFEVIRNALLEATEEMSVALQRTAFSTNIKTRLDYSCAFVDAAGRMVAQSFGQPAHLVTAGRLVPRAVAEFGPENIHPGDQLVVNDPHRQASHLNDFFFIAPFYFETQPDRVCRQYLPPRRRRRRGTGQYRLVPGDLSGGTDSSRREARDRRRGRRGAVEGDPGERAREEGGRR